MASSCSLTNCIGEYLPNRDCDFCLLLVAIHWRILVGSRVNRFCCRCLWFFDWSILFCFVWWVYFNWLHLFLFEFIVFYLSCCFCSIFLMFFWLFFLFWLRLFLIILVTRDCFHDFFSPTVASFSFCCCHGRRPSYRWSGFWKCEFRSTCL